MSKIRTVESRHNPNKKILIRPSDMRIAALIFTTVTLFIVTGNYAIALGYLQLWIPLA